MIPKTSLQTFLFGFMSGFCLLLSGNTLNFWLAESKVDLITLGLFTLVALPYSLKYFIAVAMDKLDLPIRFWLFIAQIIIFVCLINLAVLDPSQDKEWIAGIALALALGAAIQDIYLDKSRIDKTHSNNSGSSAGGYIVGYRFGMLTSGAALIFLSSLVSWTIVFYVASAILLLISSMIHMVIPAHFKPRHSIKQHTVLFGTQLIRPIYKIAKGQRLVLIISLIILYRLADNLLAVLVNPFQLQLGFNAAEIATASKFFGTTMAIIGGIIGGKLLQRHGIGQSLFSFGLIHLISHILFIVQAKVGHNLGLLYLVNGVESLTGSMAMVSYIAYITSLCNQRYGTVQYALLSSIMGISRILLPTSAGAIASYTSWEVCFIIITLLGVPGVILSSKTILMKLSSNK